MSKIVSQTELDEELLRAAAGGDLERVAQLLAQGANVNAVNEHGRNPLQVAIAGLLNPSLVRILCEAGVNLDAADNLGFTALVRLASTANSRMSEHVLESMEILLAMGADPFIRDDFGNSFLTYLCMETEGYERSQNKAQLDTRYRFSRWFHIALEVFVKGIIRNEGSIEKLLPEKNCPPTERVALLLSAAAALFNTDVPREARDKAITELCRDAGGSSFRLCLAIAYILEWEALPPLVTESGFLKALTKILALSRMESSPNTPDFPDRSGELTFSPSASRRLLEILASALDCDEGAVFEFLSLAGGENLKNWLSEASKAEGTDTNMLISRLAGRLRETSVKGDQTGTAEENAKSSWSPIAF